MKQQATNRRTWLAQALAFAGLGYFPSEAAAQLTREEDLKAALLISFVRFTEWPAGAAVDAPIVVGIVGQPELLASTLKLAAGKSAHGRPIVVRGVRYAADVKQCQLVHYGSLQGKKLEELMPTAGEQSVLTIGESDKFLQAGGAIQLFELDGKLSFEANLRVLAEAQLNVSSKLLRLGYTGRRSRP